MISACLQVSLLTGNLGDGLFVILGCMGMAIPGTMNPRGCDRFEVARECRVHGSMEVQSLLGPLAVPWVLCTNAKKDAYRIYPWFANWVAAKSARTTHSLVRFLKSGGRLSGTEYPTTRPALSGSRTLVRLSTRTQGLTARSVSLEMREPVGKLGYGSYRAL